MKCKHTTFQAKQQTAIGKVTKKERTWSHSLRFLTEQRKYLYSAFENKGYRDCFNKKKLIIQ